jgi:hypothetical protein
MKRTIAAAVFALLTVTAPAHAAIIQWNLDNVAEIGNPSVTFTGFFDYDTVANAGGGASPDFSITMLTGGSPDFTWSPSNSFGVFGGSGEGNAIFNTGTNSPAPLPFLFTGLNLVAEVPDVLVHGTPPYAFGDGSFSPLTLQNNTGGCLAHGSCFYEGPAGQFAVGLQGSLTTAEVSPVPLPAALPLFSSGVIALAGLAWRSRGKGS